MDFLTIIIIVGILILIVGAGVIIKSVSMYKKSEDDKKYDEMLSKPLEKFSQESADELAKKYEEKKGE